LWCSIRLREAQKESDELKQLYVEVCSSKEKLLATLDCEQKAKKDLATLLDIETEKLTKAQADLETERQKVSAAVAVLNITTTTDPLHGDMLIDVQLINICPILLKIIHRVHKITQFYPVLSQFNLFLTSIPCSFKIHFNIILTYMTTT